MTTEKQIEANRQNAKLGGVKTDEGKAVSKYNALKHGILSREVFLEGEDESTLLGLGKRIREEMKPVGEVEIILADIIVSNVWRKRRLLEVERAVMEYEKEEAIAWKFNFEKGEAHGMKKAMKKMLVNDDIEKLVRYDVAIERSIYKALHELQRIQATRSGKNPSIPIAIDVDVASD